MARINLGDNEYLEQFVSTQHIDCNNTQFWYQLLSCSFNFMRVQNHKLVDKTLEPYLVRLELSNSQSSNIGSLLRVFMDRFSKIKTPSGQSTEPYYIFQTFNALYLLKSICKSYIETVGEEPLIRAFKARVDVTPQQSTPSQPMPLQQFMAPTQQQLPLPLPQPDPSIVITPTVSSQSLHADTTTQ